MGQIACGNDQDPTNKTTYNTLVTEIYDSVTRPEGFDPFLTKLCQYTNSAFSIMNTIRTDVWAAMGGWQHGFRPEDLDSYMESGAFNEDPIMQAVLSSVPGSFMTLREVIAWDVLQKTDGYKQWVEPLGLIDAAGGLICSEGSVRTSLFVQRINEQGEFDSEHIALFNSLVPHLQRAIGLYSRLLDNSASHLPLTAALDTFKTPTIVFDPRGMVMFANEKARNFIEQRNWLVIEGSGALTSRNGELATRLNNALFKNFSYSISELDKGQSVIHADIDGEQISFCMQPFNAPGETGQHGGALLFIHQQNQTIDESKIRMIEELFHLTPAEAQISLLLSQGMTIKAISEFSGRKEETARSQLKSTFAKTGVNSQSQLVSLILTSPVFLT